MNSKLVLATSRGVRAYERSKNNWQPTAHGLEHRRVTSIIARQGVILAGTTDGVYRSDDFGKTWREASNGLSTRYVRWMAFHPDISDLEFAGTEPANIFVSHDGGESWRECAEVAQFRDAHKWYLPYSKGAGCIRGFAFHGSRAYAAAEVGGALRSDDRGETWVLCEGSTGTPDLDSPPAPYIYPDVHSIAVHPSSPDLVFAPTGGGFYRSTDGGKTWELQYDCYCRAVWLDPNDAKHLILGPADHVDSNGRIEETHDGGKSWLEASQGLTMPWRKHMVERFVQVSDGLIAVLSNGTLITASLKTLEWNVMLANVKDINMVTAM
ncbi:MAG: hypothetical protein HZB51_25290 [Chloroflexi bacterium]|nr:hypothetical protein [Chloroflexota bacterium]